MDRLTYPTAPTADQVDDYHGTLVADPYRPLEETDAPATRRWIAEQNALTAKVLGSSVSRTAIRERLAELWDHPRAGAPWRRGDRWFQLRNTGLQDQDVLWTAASPDGEGRILARSEPPQHHGDHDARADRRVRERRARRMRPERGGLGLAHVGGAQGRHR
jgi:hypothetical protein